MENPFDDLPDATPSGTIERALPHVFVHAKEPLVLVMKHAHVTWNKDYAARRTLRAKEHSDAVEKNDDATLRVLRADLYAETVISGWKNCNGKDGAALAYSPALAKLLLAEIDHKGLADETDAAFLEAMRTDNFRRSPAAIVESLGK